MGFAGNLRTLSLPEVVQTLARIQATGILRLAADEGHRDVVFNQGGIIGVEFAEGAERQALLQRMVMLGKLDPQAAAAITSSNSEFEVVQSLIEQGLVSSEDVLEAQASQAEEELISLCTWEAADFVFHDAGPEEPDASALVDKYASIGLTINSGSLLMEAARRMDEWARLKEKLPDPTIVLGVANGQDEGLAEASAEYPAMAVIPLIDAMRTIEDIVNDAVVTRLDVYATIVMLLERQLVCQLSREDLIAHADYWKEQHNNQLAAKLYRRSLAQFPTDRDTQIKLGACLEYLGDSDEAAQCYGQLAISCLDEGDPGRASEFARHAVSLRATDPKLRQILARAHFSRGDAVAAVVELKEIIKIYLELGQLEDARGTCLKILDINKGDEFARRELARIFSRVENDQQSEDVIVCVQCATVNHREAQSCSNCKASLQLTCLSCGRVVAVSDRLCIFCGAHPHSGNQGRRAGGSPTTTRIINHSGARRAAGSASGTGHGSPTRQALAQPGAGSSGSRQVVAISAATAAAATAPHSDLEQLVSTAHANEEAGNFEAALQTWREVAKRQPDNPHIIAHIRDLEVHVNQLAVEQKIDVGHRLSRTRHPWQAAKAYRNALHLMSNDDPRAKPVADALARAERDQRKIGGLYAGAGIALLVCGFLAARPYWQIHRFDRAAGNLRPRIDSLAALPQAQLGSEMSDINAAMQRLSEEAELIRGAYGDKAKREKNELWASFHAQRTLAAVHALEDIDKMLQARNVGEVDRLIAAFDADFANEFEPQRLQQVKDRAAELRKQLKIQADERQVAPKKLAAAKKHEEDSRFDAAIEGYRELKSSNDPQVATEAQASIARLEPREQAFLAAWNQAVALGATDLVRCDQALTAIADQARAWGREGEQLKLREEAQTRIKAAEQAFAALPADAGAAQLEAFIVAHPATPQMAQARARLGSLQSRMQGRDQALALFQQQVEARQYEQAWQTGRDLINGYGAMLQPGQVVLPLVVESLPSGATVTLAGKNMGKTPVVIGWRPPQGGKPGDDGDLVVATAGWRPHSVALRSAGSAWRLGVNLQRQSLWQISLGKQVAVAHRMPDGSVLMLAGDTLANLDNAGRVRWRHGLGTDDLGDGRARLAHQPAVFPDGRLAFGLPGQDVAIIDARGNALAKITTNQEVRGRPLVYTNDVFGAETRLAVASDQILSGAVGSDPLRIPLPAPAISGPLALERDLDKVLIVGTVTGHLIGILEQSRKPVWDLDLQATDISQLLPINDNLLVTVLDGSKLAAIQVRPEVAAVSWSQQLKAPAIGEPALTTSGIVVAAGSSVLRFGRDGTTVPGWTLPSPVSSPVAASGDYVAVGTQGGTLHLYKGDQALWATPCGQPVTAVAVLADRVIVGLQDGTVLAFSL